MIYINIYRNKLFYGIFRIFILKKFTWRDGTVGSWDPETTPGLRAEAVERKR